MTEDSRPIWPAFVLASSLFAIFGGFLLGGMLFLLRSISEDGGSWSSGATQAHGHVQLFGWGGLTVLGIGLHFLPRLMSVQLTRSRVPWLILGFLSAGLLLRAVAGPTVSAAPRGDLRAWAMRGLLLSASLELIAVLIAICMVGALFRRWFVGSRTVPSRGVASLIVLAFTSLGAAMLINVIGTIDASTSSLTIVPFWADDSTVMLGLVGFLTSISIAMSARLFPLYAQTYLPRERWLRVTVLLLLAGIIGRGAGIISGARSVTGAGEILLAGAMICAIVTLNVFQKRRQLPRRRVRIVTNPLQLHIVSAYIWLAVAAICGLLHGANLLGAEHLESAARC